MNFALEPREWRFVSPADAAASHGAHPDWHVLRARLRVGLEARAALEARGGEAPSRLPGSFSHSASLSLDRISASCDRVNQTSSVNRKRVGCIVSEVAGQSTTGERG
jgi:hypothetical protein